MAVPRIKAKTLREAAENALGNRAVALGILADPKDPAALHVIKRQTNADGTTATGDPHFDQYLIEIDGEPPTMKSQLLKVVLPGVTLEGNPVSNDDYFGIADAVFWTLPAIEKFVLPYYASFDQARADAVLAKFAMPTTLAIIHLPDSETFGGDDGNSISLHALVVSEDGKGVSVEPLSLR